jgi:two-component system sensor histidine kinase SenX3
LITISVALSVVAMVAVVVACLLSRRALRQRLETETSSDAGHLHEAEIAVSRLAGALDAIPQGVVICDDTGREVFRNQVAIAYVRSRHGEALVEQAIQEQFVAVRGAGAALRTLDLYGPPRRVLLLSAVDLRDGLQPAGALVLVDDVSERRRLEAVRRDFVVNITHELKTPVGALGLLADTIAAEDDAQVVRRLAERMTEEAFRVGRVIDDLLDLSRIEAEESPRRESVPVYVVVAEAVERVRPLAQTRGITIDADECARWHSVQGDHRQLVSAVANLLDNACKYSDAGSSVELRSRVEDGSLELEVCDHGIGIPGRDLERVFERFYRVDRARSRETGGTGLGLAIVRHVATNHKGEVRVTSREGEGSVFTLRLPSASQRGGLPPAALVAVPVKAELR